MRKPGPRRLIPGCTTNVLVALPGRGYGCRAVPQARADHLGATRDGVLRPSRRGGPDDGGRRGLRRGLGLAGLGPGLGGRGGLVRALDVRPGRRRAGGPRAGARPRPGRPGDRFGTRPQEPGLAAGDEGLRRGHRPGHDGGGPAAVCERPGRPGAGRHVDGVPRGHRSEAGPAGRRGPRLDGDSRWPRWRPPSRPARARPRGPRRLRSS